LGWVAGWVPCRSCAGHRVPVCRGNPPEGGPGSAEREEPEAAPDPPGPEIRVKRYDRDYFHRWYAGARAVVSADVVRRKARLALAAAEHLLGRDARSVLDVGAGEGRWRAELLRMRRG